MRAWRPRIFRVCKRHSSGDGVALNRAIAFLCAAPLVFGEKMDGIAADRSLELVSVKVACEPVSLLLQLQGKIDRSTVKLSPDDPPTGDGTVHGTRPFLRLRWPRVLCQQNSRNKKQ